MNFWYSAQQDELFLDLDRPYRKRRAMNVLHAWLQDRKEFPQIDFAEHYPTKTDGHEHVVLRFAGDVEFLDKLSIRLLMMDDPIRVAYIVKRFQRSCVHHDLLMSKGVYHRLPDAVCECTEKHRGSDVTWNCPALTALLGFRRSMDPFPRTGVPEREPIRVPFGRMNLEQIKNWSPQHEKRENEQSNGTRRPKGERVGFRHGENDGAIPGVAGAHENTSRIDFSGGLAGDGVNGDCAAVGEH